MKICNLNASVPTCSIPPSLHPPPGRVWPVGVLSSSNAQCEQFNDTNSDHQHGERDRIVVKQIPLLGIHINALSGYCRALTRHFTRGSPKGVSSVSLACCDAGDGNSMRRIAVADLSLRPLARLAQEEESGSASGEARGGGRMGARRSGVMKNGFPPHQTTILKDLAFSIAFAIVTMTLIRFVLLIFEQN